MEMLSISNGVMGTIVVTLPNETRFTTAAPL